MPEQRRIIVDSKLPCSRCKEVKHIDEFLNRCDSLSGKSSRCKKCITEAKIERNQILPDTHSVIINGRRTCRICRESKSLIEFGRTVEGKFGRAYRCKPCRVKLETERLKNPRKGKYKTNIPRNFKRYADPYGLTPEDKQRILDSQLGLCANRGCGRVLTLERGIKMANKACVDHCHTTGVIRGLLCHSCNVALGFLGEDKNRIFGLTEYINKYSNPIKGNIWQLNKE